MSSGKNKINVGGKMLPKISVIMPVYNAEKTLSRAIESILNQSFSNFEFIIINEAQSVDASKKIIEKYQKQDGRIQLVQKINEKKGVAVSLNMGLRLSRGEFIARMDADDYSYPDRFEKQLDFLVENSKIVLCGSQFKLIMDGNAEIVKLPSKSEEIKAALLFYSPIAHPSVMFRRSVFLEREWFYDETDFAEDYGLWMRVVKYGEIVNLEEVLLEYHVDHGENISAIKNREFQKNVVELKKRQFLDRLNISLNKRQEELFCPEMNIELLKEYKNYMLEGFYLLQEIEYKNSILKIYDEKILSKTLCEQWNKWLRYFYIQNQEYIIDSQVHLPVLNIDEQGSFVEKICRVLDIKEKNVAKAIKIKIEYVSTCAKKFNNIVIFGAGEICKKYISARWLVDKILCCCDNNLNLKKIESSAIEIIRPQQLGAYSYEIILIASNKYYADIYHQLVTDYKIDKKIIFPIGILNFI